MDESTLITMVQEGNKQAFENLVFPYIKKAKQTAYLLLSDYSLAEDAVQEGLLEVYLCIRNYDSNKGRFSSWFNKIIINTTLKVKRKRRLFYPLYDVFTIKEENRPDKQYDLSEESYELYNSIMTLKGKFQTVLILYYFRDLSLIEIAEVLSIKEGTVKSRMFTAKKKLKEKLSNQNLHNIKGCGLAWKKD